MLNIEENMKLQYTEYYIAFLDLLGFKNIINEKTCHDIFTIFLNIKNPVKQVQIFQNGSWHSLIDKDTVEKIKIKIMSDSILFYIPTTEKDALCTLITVCTWFQLRMIQLQEPVLLRGGIVCGDMLALGDVTYGPGLTNAYLMEDKIAKYPRIIMEETLVEKVFRETSKKCHPLLQKFLFRDFDEYCTLDYLSMLPNDNDHKQAVQVFNTHIDSVLHSELTPSIREKYLYLEEKMKIVLAQGDQTDA